MANVEDKPKQREKSTKHRRRARGVLDLAEGNRGTSRRGARRARVGATGGTGNAAKIAGYLGGDDTFDRALERFAVAYAGQIDADNAAFTKAADEQRIDVARGSDPRCRRAFTR